MIKKLELTRKYTSDGKHYFEKYPDNEELMNKINEIIDYINKN